MDVVCVLAYRDIRRRLLLKNPICGFRFWCAKSSYRAPGWFARSSWLPCCRGRKRQDRVPRPKGLPASAGRLAQFAGRNAAACFLNSVGPGLWSGQSGKELVLTKPFLHLETERQATEVGRYGSGVLLENRSLAWSQVPCAEQWLTVGQPN